MGNLLEIRDLKVSFATNTGKVNAVNGVSYSVKEGEIVGIVGESGSGKSVHALSIMQLITRSCGQIDSGSVKFRDIDLLALTPKKMRAIRGREIAMIFQDPISSLNPVYTIGFQMREVLECHLGITRAEAHDRSEQLLIQVGISDARQRLDSYPHELSGGMRQRVMIAIAMACDPSLLIADEPTTALDVTIQAQIVQLIKRLQREHNLTVIWISHDLGVIAGLAHTVNVMYAGMVVERGPVNDIYKSPCHPYTKGLLESVPRLDHKSETRLNSIPGSPPDMTRLPNECPFAPRCGHADDRCNTKMPIVETTYSQDHTVMCWNWRDVVNGDSHSDR